MRGWTATVARLGVANDLGVTWWEGASLTVVPLAPLVHIHPGGQAVGVVRTIQRLDTLVVATGLVNEVGADLIASGDWLPEVDLDEGATEGISVGGTALLRAIAVKRIVLGQLPLWSDLSIRLDPPTGPAP